MNSNSFLFSDWPDRSPTSRRRCKGFALFFLWFCLMHFDSPVLGSQSPGGNLAQIPEVKARWARASEDELNKAVQQGNPEALFVQALRQLERSHELSREGTRWTFAAISNGTNLTEQEERESHEKWKGRPESELLGAAKGGERGAQWQYGARFAEKAIQPAADGVNLLQRAATNGFVAAEVQLGGLYYKGGPAGHSTEKARYWFAKAADHGSEAAQHRLARMLLVNAEDVPRAIELLQAAADQNCKMAKYDLALQYACGNGEPRHSGETPFALLAYAATNGLPEAALAIAERFRAGMGVDRDLLKALAWYRMACDAALKYSRTDESEHYLVHSNMDENDKVIAAVNSLLGPLNEDGTFSGKGFVQDAEFLNVAGIELRASRGLKADAQLLLGSIFEHGELTKRDYVRAFFWYKMAAACGASEGTAEAERVRPFINSAGVEQASKWMQGYKLPTGSRSNIKPK